MQTNVFQEAARAAVVLLLRSAGYRVHAERDCEDRPLLRCVHAMCRTTHYVRVLSSAEPSIHELDLTHCDFETRPILVHVNSAEPPYFRVLVPPYPYADPDTGLLWFRRTVREEPRLAMSVDAVVLAERRWRELLRRTRATARA